MQEVAVARSETKTQGWPERRNVAFMMQYTKASAPVAGFLRQSRLISLVSAGIMQLTDAFQTTMADTKWWVGPALGLPAVAMAKAGPPGQLPMGERSADKRRPNVNMRPTQSFRPVPDCLGRCRRHRIQ
jgi:hypothetical protein